MLYYRLMFLFLIINTSLNLITFSR